MFSRMRRHRHSPHTAVAALAVKRGKGVDFSVVNFAQIGEGRLAFIQSSSSKI